MDFTQELSRVSSGRRLLSALQQDALAVAAFAVVLVLALGLRLYGLSWDEGFSYTPHPDERAILFKVNELSLPSPGEFLDAERSPWNPRWFPYGSFPLYVLKGLGLAYSLVTGEGIRDLRLAGRAISALADVATVAMVYLLGSRIYDRRTALLASAFTALAVVHIQLSHFFAVDTVQALLAVAAMYFMYRVAREGRPRDSALAGAFVGLGMATKVSQAPIYGALVVAHLMYAFSMSGTGNGESRPYTQRCSAALQGLALSIAVSVAALFVAQPYAFLDWRRFFSDVVEQSEMVRRIRDYPYTRQYVDTTPYLYHVRQLAAWGLGWPLGIVAWAGLVYASVRGVPLRYAPGYLAIGWLLPAAVLMLSMGLFAILAAAGIALAALLATLPIRSEKARMDVLLLSWVVPLFLITGAFQVKFMRYLLPITPFLLLFASRMLLDLWDRASQMRPDIRPWLAVGIALLLAFTTFFALAFVNMYGQEHTAVRASQWINSNAPTGSVILKEHWEEGLPGLHGHTVYELPLYEEDRPDKLRALSERLAGADYLVFFSNRLYGTIPRLPERYPQTTAYYRLLFSGQLGYELVAFETTYPNFMGVSFVDDAFGRPGLPEPAPLRDYKPSPVVLNLGFADESFSVYDHPKVLVFENVDRLSADSIRRAIEGAAPPSAPRAAVPSARGMGLMMSPEYAEAQRQGGTWASIVTPHSWTSRLPLLAWLIVIEGMALLALPIAFLAFRPLPDRGYLLSKALGLLLVSLVVWLLASLRLMAFSPGSITVALLLLAAGSLWAMGAHRRELAGFVRRRWPILLTGEAVFLAAFFALVMLRMANPDLWHPFRGGEKPMDFAYLNAVLRSSYMPPYDPWFAGGYINYYYWGQFLVATLIRATGIDPGVAFNLAVPTFFAMTAAGAYSIVYNLAEATRHKLTGHAAPDNVQSHASPAIAPFGWSPVLAGLAGAVFVTVLGNLDGAVQVGEGVWRALVQGRPFGEFDFWRSSRMMPPDPPGFEITEFPFFTFLFADLHAHLMALPFTVLALGAALAVVMGAMEPKAAQQKPNDYEWSKLIHKVGLTNTSTPKWHYKVVLLCLSVVLVVAAFGFATHRPLLMLGLVRDAVFTIVIVVYSIRHPLEMARLGVLGVTVGSLRVINTWDFPTYLIIGGAAVVMAEVLAHGGIGLVPVARAALKSIFVFAVGYVAFLPFHLSYETFFSSVESTTNTTVLWQFLAIHGLFVFIIGSFVVYQLRDWLRACVSYAVGRWSWLAEAIAALDAEMPEGTSRLTAGWALALVLGALLLGLALTAIFTGVAGSTIPFAALLLALVLLAAARWLGDFGPDLPQVLFALMMVGVALALVIGLDVVRVEGDIDRMNSVFKFYLQAWVLLGLASAYFLWRLAHGRRVSLVRLPLRKKAWTVGLAALLLSASVYPVMGTQDRLRDRFDGHVTPLTLDGTAFIQRAVYRDERGPIDLAADFEGIQWLRQNVEGSPVVLEAVTPTYRWGSRVSIYTGLPTVVGWQWHQEQQRWDYRWAVPRRIEDVERIYRTTDPAQALSLLRTYDVEYIYVGQVERLYYPGPGLDKFEGSMSPYLDKVFESEEVAIYRVEG